MHITQNITADRKAKRGSGSPATAKKPLSGARILVVEDELLLAHDLAATIEEGGGSAEGPLHRLADAMAYTGLDSIDAAVLDVDIAGDEVFAFADRLSAAGIPIVFHTARADTSRLTRRYPGAQVCCKPCLARGLLTTLSAVLSGRARAAS